MGAPAPFGWREVNVKLTPQPATVARGRYSWVDQLMSSTSISPVTP